MESFVLEVDICYMLTEILVALSNLDAEKEEMKLTAHGYMFLLR